MPTQIKALHATSRKDSVDDEYQSVLLLRCNVDVMELRTTCCEATEPTLPATTVATALVGGQDAGAHRGPTPEKRKARNPLEIQGLRALCEEGESNPHGC